LNFLRYLNMKNSPKNEIVFVIKSFIFKNLIFENTSKAFKTKQLETSMKIFLVNFRKIKLK